jgi:hypothetical protein
VCLDIFRDEQLLQQSTSFLLVSRLFLNLQDVSFRPILPFQLCEDRLDIAILNSVGSKANAFRRALRRNLLERNHFSFVPRTR